MNPVKWSDLHVGSVLVVGCQNESCAGTETGCPASNCDGPHWHKWTHKQFVDHFSRCPRGCGFKEQQTKARLVREAMK